MSKENIKALEESAEKYGRGARGEVIGTEGSDCPLCGLYNNGLKVDCEKCPIFLETGLKFCRQTPWVKIRNHCTEEHARAGKIEENCTTCMELCAEEHLFLTKLLAIEMGKLKEVEMKGKGECPPVYWELLSDEGTNPEIKEGQRWKWNYNDDIYTVAVINRQPKNNIRMDCESSYAWNGKEYILEHYKFIGGVMEIDINEAKRCANELYACVSGSLDRNEEHNTVLKAIDELERLRGENKQLEKMLKKANKVMDCAGSLIDIQAESIKCLTRGESKDD